MKNIYECCLYASCSSDQRFMHQTKIAADDILIF